MKLKEIRKNLGLTQPETANILGIPFRTYCRYEAENKYEGSFKYNQIINSLNNYAQKNILSIETIKKITNDVFSKFNVSVCYLFGSYSKGKATSDSDIDLMIVSDVEGFEFFEILSELENKLNKKIDLIRLETAIQNTKLMNEILKDGIKIYG